MMLAELKMHRTAYFVLTLLVVGLITATLLLAQSRLLLRVSFVLFSASYFAWGIITHSRSGSVSLDLIAEYAGIAALGGVLLLLLTI